jgi:Integrase core domain
MTGAQIAEVLVMPLSTVSGILQRIGLGKLSRLEAPEPPHRYERRHPGELIHIDIKKLGRIEPGAGHRITGNRGPGQRARGAGWEYVHVAIDDATWLAYVEVLADEKATTAIGFLRRALAYYRRHQITVQRVMSDNGSAYRSAAHALACRALGLRHLRTRPYRPRTNGKARALHPYAACRLGLRRHLPRQRTAHRPAVRLARALQLPTTARRPQPPAAGQPPRAADRRQPPRVLQLARPPGPVRSVGV